MAAVQVILQKVQFRIRRYAFVPLRSRCLITEQPSYRTRLISTTEWLLSYELVIYAFEQKANSVRRDY